MFLSTVKLIVDFSCPGDECVSGQHGRGILPWVGAECDRLAAFPVGHKELVATRYNVLCSILNFIRRRPSAQFLSYLKQKDAPPRVISEVSRN
jgi:hypothetical protein